MLPKIIFTYWHSCDIPDFINACVSTWSKSNPDFQISTYNDDKFRGEFYIPPNYDSLIPQAKSDYVRLCLIEKYGGIWLDASMIVVGSLSAIYSDIDYVTGFYASWSDLYMESWFIAAPQNNILISKWKSEFIRAIDMGFDNYKEYYIGKIESIDVNESYKKKLRECYNSLPYLTVFACYKHTCLFEGLNDAKMVCSIEGPFYYSHIAGYNQFIESEILCNSNHTIEKLNYPLIKICKFGRECIIKKIASGAYIGGESIIGKYIIPYYIAKAIHVKN
jgi:hypothetical protein